MRLSLTFCGWLQLYKAETVDKLGYPRILKRVGRLHTCKMGGCGHVIWWLIARMRLPE